MPDDQTSELPRGWETILLVEDDASVRTLTKEFLAAAGYQVLEAGNGLEALALLQTHRGAIHALLTDVVMPQMSGRDLALRMADLGLHLPVLFMSGYTDGQPLQEMAAAGQHLLPKPFTLEELLRNVREILDLAGSQ